MTPTGLHHLPDEEHSHSDAIAQLLRVLAILRRRWLVVVVTTVLSLAAMALAINLLQPRWRASSSIVLHMSGPQVLDKIKGVSEDAESRLVGYKEYYQTQRTIMHSRAVAEQALTELGLANDPVFLGIAHIESADERAILAGEIDPVQRLRDLVTIEEIRNSRVIEIAAEYPDPEIARDIANAVTNAYVQYVRSNRSEHGRQAKENIGLERDSALDRVRAAEGELDAFKTGHKITSISLADRQNIVSQRLSALSERETQARARLIELHNNLEQVRTLHAQGNLTAATILPEDKRALFESLRQEQVKAESEFQTVDIEYGPKHEEHRKSKAKLDLVNARIVREANALIESLQAQLNATRATEADLKKEIAEENRKALELSSLEIRYRQLEREATGAADDYMRVAQRDTEIAITNRVEAEGIEILDRATTPQHPVFPRKVLLFALALLAGLGLGSLLALTIDFRDQRIRGLLDLERALSPFGLPVLGQLPLIPADVRLGAGNARAQRRQRDLYAHLYPQSLMAERCRGIRTSLAFAQGEQARTLMITSPSTSEGKSSIATNLALSFCQAKKRVVLIDADLRRPRIHQIFPPPVDVEEQGLSNLLREQTELDRVLVRAGDDAPDNLLVLPCGPVPENPAELLDSAGFRRILAEVRERYDIVVIDTPPVLPVTDALVIARQVDGVVVVTRCDQTTRGELQRTLSSLVQSDANIVGVVLNEVDSRQERYDYNASYYTYRAQGTNPEAGM